MTSDRDLRSEKLNEIITKYLRDVEAGQAPSHEQLLAQYPELANRLQELLDQVDQQRPDEPVVYKSKRF